MCSAEETFASRFSVNSEEDASELIENFEANVSSLEAVDSVSYYREALTIGLSSRALVNDLKTYTAALSPLLFTRDKYIMKHNAFMYII